jgi:lauroyl/myristoyl acyltransferase
MHFLRALMTFSSHLQSKEFMESLPGISRDQLREHIFAQGEVWFDKHQEEADIIRRNCKTLTIDVNEELVKDIQCHVLLHYYEKLLPFCMTPRQLHEYLVQRVLLPKEIGLLKKSLGEKKGVLLSVCHYGAVELIGPSLAAQGIPFTGTLRFATAALSEAARGKARQLAASGLFADLGFIEIGTGPTAASLEMAAVLRRGKLLCAVFDEPARLGVEVSVLDRRILGNAGIEKLVAFMNGAVTVMAAFMIRTGNETYELHLSELASASVGLTQRMFATFERECRSELSQWYLLHEEISFVK